MTLMCHLRWQLDVPDSSGNYCSSVFVNHHVLTDCYSRVTVWLNDEELGITQNLFIHALLSAKYKHTMMNIPPYLNGVKIFCLLLHMLLKSSGIVIDFYSPSYIDNVYI